MCYDCFFISEMNDLKSVKDTSVLVFACLDYKRCLNACLISAFLYTLTLGPGRGGFNSSFGDRGDQGKFNELS